MTSGAAVPRARVTAADRALVNPFAALSGVLARPMASYHLLLASSALLLGIGLLMVLSASSIDAIRESQSAFTVFTSQLLYAALGVPAFWVALCLPPRAYRVLGYPLLLVSIALLLVLFLAPDSPVAARTTAYGPALWIDLGPLVIQPSEGAKLALALWGADVLVRKRALLVEWKHLAIPLFPVTVLLMVLVGYSDLGTMLCLMLVFLGLLWVSGVRFRVFAVMAGLAVTGVVTLVRFESYRMERISSFRDPFADPTGLGHQAVQGLYALGSGGWWGVGLGASRAKWDYLPNSHNDFIFAIIGEELGLVGCLVVLTLFWLLAYAGLRIARQVRDPFARLVAAACTAWLIGQAAINIGGVVGLVPITGLPLPFISAGGSSLVLTMFVIGMLASFARHEPAAARALHARGRPWWVRMTLVPLPPLPVERPVARTPPRTAHLSPQRAPVPR